MIFGIQIFAVMIFGIQIVVVMIFGIQMFVVMTYAILKCMECDIQYSEAWSDDNLVFNVRSKDIQNSKVWKAGVRNPMFIKIRPEFQPLKV